ncbi:helix-turn-helix domain-containing protein [Agrococcus lahaulensis]|uniref:helix-turn-helix domain-containing protein n=1 Tax=Agrococcus lahaulensis TaxID=341722 RepID=UPI000553447A|nr:helix-turn-helix transcriptional regulator [Agrococcus lahaulensis]
MSVESRIGASLAALRGSAGMTQQALAARAGTPVATVVGVEQGSIEPPASLVARLAAAVAAQLREEGE